MQSNKKSGLLASVLAASWTVGHAAQWDLQGSFGQELQFNDNISLQTQKQSVFGYVMTPRLQASRKTGSLDTGITAQGEIRRYDVSRWDCENFNIGLDNSLTTTRSVFQLDGHYGISCSYAQQIQDTGLLSPNNQSESYSLTPSWSWRLNKTDTLSVNTSYAKTSYTSTSNFGRSTALNGNDTASVNLNGTHAWSQRLGMNGGVFFSNSQFTNQPPVTQNMYGFQGGGNYLIDPQWSVSGSAGLRWVDSHRSTGGTSVNQGDSLKQAYLVNANLAYKGKLDSYSIALSRTINPSAIGQLLQYDSLTGNLSHPLARDVTLDLNANFQKSQSLDGQNNANFNRTYFTATAGVTWQVARDWRLKGSYAYRWQQYQGDERVRDSNAVMLFLNYDWDGIQNSL